MHTRTTGAAGTVHMEETSRCAFSKVSPKSEVRLLSTTYKEVIIDGKPFLFSLRRLRRDFMDASSHVVKDIRSSRRNVFVVRDNSSVQ